LVRKHTDPDLAAPLDEACHRDARRFNLTVRQPARLERLQSVVAERHFAASPGLPAHPAALLLPELDLLRHQHDRISNLFIWSSGHFLVIWSFWSAENLNIGRSGHCPVSSNDQMTR